MNKYRLGIDVGSTTIKMVLTNGLERKTMYDEYRRHQTKVKECLNDFLRKIQQKFGNINLSVCMTGSVGMGIAERYNLPFVQEVIATTNYVHAFATDIATMIDIGGEDAKMVFFDNGKPTDLRMNGNCSGGTGAFIDQMAILLNVTPTELGELAATSTHTYPIASRCGVFCKTDIQNLIARNVDCEDIAASIFHAIVVQTITTLAHGHDIKAPILLCGGPLTFIPSLQKAFTDYLHLTWDNIIVPEKANLVPAWGAALAENTDTMTVEELMGQLEKPQSASSKQETDQLPAIFESTEQYNVWKRQMSQHAITKAEWKSGNTDAVIGIDSGSTTTKIVVLNRHGEMLHSFYQNNNGNPIQSVKKGLLELSEICLQHNATLNIIGSCSTGYGEDLIKAAFGLNSGIVETMAHYMAAKHINRNVSFVLDIGGQDMKALFIENGVINRIEVNEACSSGCGSFISTFAQSLDCTVEQFAEMACLAHEPCDLGTRCTVFMNSKVKQMLREGTSADNIAAGLSYSVIKNCLYKVLRLKSVSVLGKEIVVQGGTMRNDSVVRALERLTGRRVFRSDCPELMGAFGCALYAMQMSSEQGITLQDMLAKAEYTSKTLYCHGCDNNCAVTQYKFANDNVFYSGNRCEKVFANKGQKAEHGANAYEKKRSLLFDRHTPLAKPLMTIGIPRCLNMYEEYPFWYTLLTECNIDVRLSDISNFIRYEQTACKVMSDNICFPAKLVHSHIQNLQHHEVDRIFMPFVVYEHAEQNTQNSYNCPIVTGYSQVIKGVENPIIPIDSPTISFKDLRSLYHQCKEYLASIGVEPYHISTALKKALKAQRDYETEITEYNDTLLAEARKNHKLAVLLAGRPYHADTLIQHKVSDMIAAQGAYVLTDDLVRHKNVSISETNYLSQWAFTNRIMKSAQWAAEQDENVQYMELTSFGCGPDAFLTDEIQSVLRRHGKNCTLLKIDDVNNIGSLKLRVRSLIESLKAKTDEKKAAPVPQKTLPPFTSYYSNRKIIVPFFTPFISPFIQPVLKLAGYDIESLPMSDSSSCYWGLKYSNNEICYPATLVVGDIVKAFRSGKYDPDTTCVAMTQTGGQCRASNYLALIRKALIENGYTDTPVISVSFGSGIENEQPGFKISIRKMLPIAVATILYSDTIARFYYASVCREEKPGTADRLRDMYINHGIDAVKRNNPEELYEYLNAAVTDFNNICQQKECPKVGIVGEIFLKFHPFAQKNVTRWLVGQGAEVIYPSLTDFFMQSFVNIKIKKYNHIGKRYVPDFIINFFYKKVQRQIKRVNDIGSKFQYFQPFDDIFEKAKAAQDIISLSTQFGEGWLLPGEIASMARQGVKHVVSLQPFGCIANHIVEKGMEKRIKSIYPDLNILSLDFDSSVSEVNITNRLLLFINDIKSAKQQ